MSTVAYQGAEGAFSHEACRRFLPDQRAVGCASFADVVGAVTRGDADYGMLPLANNEAGETGARTLIEQGKLRIVEERVLPVRMHLLGLASASLEQVRTVVSHPVALKQCSRVIGELGVAVEEASNTAVAARELASSDRAVLASDAAAELYGLKILKRDVHDRSDNATTFAIITRQAAAADEAHGAEQASERHGAWASPLPPPGAASDWTVPQHWDELTDEDHWVWDTLFARQQTLLHGRAVREFEEALDVLQLSRPGIPDFVELNEKLGARTGWEVVAVPGIVPDDVFFEHLANRRFPAGNFIRKANQLDYLEEPDAFHDLFGHVPLLAQPAVADFMQELGCLGRSAIAMGELHRVARLYWFTVEFGLALERGKPKIYGAGILSSFGESHYSLESPKPHRLAFDLRRVLRTRYQPDAFQQSYFVIEGLDDLRHLIRDTDFASLCAELSTLPDIDPWVAADEELLAA